MALRVFDTPEATYYLGLADYSRSSAPIFEDVDFNGIDVVVIEDACSDDLFSLVPHRDTQYKDIFRRVEQKAPDAKIYAIGEVPDQKTLDRSLLVENVIGYGGMGLIAYGAAKLATDNSRRSFLKGAAAFTGGVVLSSGNLIDIVAKLDKEDIGLVTDSNCLRSTLLPTPAIGFADAVIANKISQYLVPIQKKDKAQALLVFGAAHMGIETKIVYPRIADLTIKVYRDVFAYGEKESLNKVKEFVRHKNAYEAIFRDTGLF